MSDDIDIIDVSGDSSNDVTLFGDDPAALGLDNDSPDSVVSGYDAAAAKAFVDNFGRISSSAYGYTWAFDDVAGDFVLKGKEPLKVTDEECFAEWIVNCLATQRRLYMCYDEDYGIDIDYIFGAGLGTFVLPSFLEQELRMALGVHNRYRDLRNYTWNQEGDTVTVTFTVVTNTGEEIAVNTSLFGA